MRKTGLAFLSVIVVGVMMSMPVSASTMLKVNDGTGDLCKGWDPIAGEYGGIWSPTTPLVKAGYFDMVSAWLSQKGSTYTFGMEVANALPKEGAALPDGIHAAEWAMWIDPEPWNYALNPVGVLFKIALVYDGSEYSASVVDFTAMTLTPLTSFSVDGCQFQLVFTEDNVGDFSWWTATVRAYWGPQWSAGWLFVDTMDWGSTEGQVWHDIPWPPA